MLRLPQPSQSFIEKYVEEYNKGNIITEVMVEYTDWSETFNGVYMEENEEEWKVNPKDNTITIRKIKDSWNREEVISLIKDAMITGVNIRDKNLIFNDVRDNWIDKNL